MTRRVSWILLAAASQFLAVILLDSQALASAHTDYVARDYPLDLAPKERITASALLSADKLALQVDGGKGTFVYYINLQDGSKSVQELPGRTFQLFMLGERFININRESQIVLTDQCGRSEQLCRLLVWPLRFLPNPADNGAVQMIGYSSEASIGLYQIMHDSSIKLWELPMRHSYFGDHALVDEADGSLTVVSELGEVYVVEHNGAVRFHLRPEQYIRELLTPARYDEFSTVQGGWGPPGSSVWEVQRATPNAILITLNTGTILSLNPRSGEVIRLSALIYGGPPSVLEGEKRIVYFSDDESPEDEDNLHDDPQTLTLQDCETGEVLSVLHGFEFQSRPYLLSAQPAEPAGESPWSGLHIAIKDLDGVSVLEGGQPRRIWSEPTELLASYPQVLGGNILILYPYNNRVVIISPRL